MSSARGRTPTGGDAAARATWAFAQTKLGRVETRPVRGGRLGLTARRATAGAVALFLLTNAAYASIDDTRSEISDAKRHLATLERSIASQENHLHELQSSMLALAAHIAGSRRSYEAIRGSLAATESRIAATEDRYEALRARIQQAAVAAYVRGPNYFVDAVLDADNFSAAADVLSYTDAISLRNAELSEQALKMAADLNRQRRRESALLAQSRAALQRLDGERDALLAAFVDSQQKLSTLARTRAEVGALLTRLRSRLRAEELAAAIAAAGAGTPISFGRWAQAFLSYVHAPVARNNLVVMVAWEAAEFTDAHWNPLATTYPMPGSTAFNSSRVQNYVSLQQGLEATIRTLRRPGYGYEAILAGLARNAGPMDTADAIRDSRWCRRCADGEYVVGLIDAVESYYARYASNRTGS
jgi:peptidoglycan hydrolase CwlO-like protein